MSDLKPGAAPAPELREPPRKLPERSRADSGEPSGPSTSLVINSGGESNMWTQQQIEKNMAEHRAKTEKARLAFVCAVMTAPFGAEPIVHQIGERVGNAIHIPNEVLPSDRLELLSACYTLLWACRDTVPTLAFRDYEGSPPAVLIEHVADFEHDVSTTIAKMEAQPALTAAEQTNLDTLKNLNKPRKFGLRHP